MERPPKNYPTWLDYAVSVIPSSSGQQELADLRFKLTALLKLHNNKSLDETIEETKKTRELLNRILLLLESFSNVAVPAGASAGLWVAQTRFCNTQITAHQILLARALAQEVRNVVTTGRDSLLP